MHLGSADGNRERQAPLQSPQILLQECRTDHDERRVTFHLKRPQPAFPMLLATGFSAIYPCRVPAAQMRQHPVGTGPFKFVEFKQNESIKVTKNPDYWKPGFPYL